MNQNTVAGPTIAEVRAMSAQLQGNILTTPCWHWQNPLAANLFGPRAEILFKLECLQRGGTFKTRGALAVMSTLSADALERGVVTASAGNHAIAVSYGAKLMNTSAKLVMPKTANPYRVRCCRELGAEIIFTDDVFSVFERARQIEMQEQRHFVHPFEGPLTAMGTATLGVELVEQLGKLDAVIIAIGGGGLCAGAASAIKQLQPECKVFGVEPIGANAMSQSFAAGRAVKLRTIDTIADSLSPPYVGDYTYAVCRETVDDIVTVSDEEIKAAMRLLFEEMKLAVEPAGAAAMAALCNRLDKTLYNQRVAVLVCGSNIDIETFYTLCDGGKNG